MNLDDENLTREYMEQIFPSLPKCCRNRLICIGIRGKNPLFKEYFKYYIEFESEDNYKWHDKLNSYAIAERLRTEFGLEIIYYYEAIKLN
ncbi:MAG: hypothetical protein K5829_13405 [Treponema sp.]|nr:hypothetical protein [Treponema sp.]